MRQEQLSQNQRQQLETVFIEEDSLVHKLWDELAAINPELRSFIGHEALRLFPDNTVHRARATRLVIEVVQALRVVELDSAISFDA